jgi:hypothetical protein
MHLMAADAILYQGANSSMQDEERARR